MPIRKQAEADFLYWQNVATGTLDDAVRASWAAGVGMAGGILDIKGAATFKLGTFDRMAYQAQYIATQSGPVRRLLDSIAVDSADKAIDVMRNAMMEGINPRKTAKRLAQVVSADVTRCEVIARTESARAHKEGTLARYMESDVEYVKWMSAEQMRTCPACWAMDGRVYAVDKVPNDHPNGRCVTEPMLDEEVEEARAQYGDDWGNSLWMENVTKNTGIMGKMTDEQLMHVFGSQRQIDAFRAGAPLDTAVKMIDNKTWGTSPAVRALTMPGATTPLPPPTPPKPTEKPKAAKPTVNKVPKPAPRPVAPPQPPKPVVDWKHNLPDEWTKCSIQEAQQRMEDMLSVNDDVWGTVDRPSDVVVDWTDGSTTAARLKRSGRVFVNGKATSLKSGEVNMRAEQLMQYCKMCDELKIPRPAYFNLGELGKHGVRGDCGAGINIYRDAFDKVVVHRTKIKYKPGTGDVQYIRADNGELSWRATTIDDVDEAVMSQFKLMSKETSDHEFGHFLGNMYRYENNGALTPTLMTLREEQVLGVFTNPGISEYGLTSLQENLAETWQAFVNYGRCGVSGQVADRFEELGWTRAAQKAGVIKWK